MTSFERILATVASISNDFINSTTQNVASAIKGPFFSLLAVYILFMGWHYLSGQAKEPILETVKKLLKVSIVAGVALQLASYNIYFRDVFLDGVEHFASQILTVESQANILDLIFDSMWNVGTSLINKAGYDMSGIALAICGIAVYGISVAIVAFSLFLIVLSKMMVAILLGLGPLFIVGYLFSATKRFFEQWLSSLINFSLVYILAVATNSFIKKIFDNFLSNITNIASSGSIAPSAVAPVVVVALISLFILGQVLPLASALSGGVSLSTFGVGVSAVRSGRNIVSSGANIAGNRIGNQLGKIGRKAHENMRRVPRMTVPKQTK